MARNDYKKTLKNIGRKIGELRAKKGFTQSQFAEKTGLSHIWLQQIEAGKEASIKALVEIANALDQDFLDLFKKPSTPKPSRGRPTKK